MSFSQCVNLRFRNDAVGHEPSPPPEADAAELPSISAAPPLTEATGLGHYLLRRAQIAMGVSPQTRAMPGFRTSLFHRCLLVRNIKAMLLSFPRAAV